MDSEGWRLLQPVQRGVEEVTHRSIDRKDNGEIFHLAVFCMSKAMFRLSVSA